MQGGNVYAFKSGVLREKHAVGSLNFVTISVLAWKQRKIEEPCVEMSGRNTVQVVTSR